MKIAVIGVKGIPAKQGEIESYCQEFYPRIAERGHQVDIFVQPEYSQKSWFSVYSYDNVRVIALASLPRRLNFLVSSALNTIWATLENYDVIHIQSMKAAWFSWFPQLFSTSKVIVTTHQLDCQPTKCRKLARWLRPWIERTAVKNADELVVVSKALGEYFQKKYRVSSHYIPNVPTSYFQTKESFEYGKTLGLESKRYFLYLDKLTPENRPDLLLKAFQQLQPQGWKLVLAGGIGTSVKYAMQLLAIAKPDPNIIFTNQIQGRYLAEIMHHASLLVVPANGFNLKSPLNLLEAMRGGTPVLASDTAVHRELIGSDRGLLFDSENLDSLITKLKYVLTQPSLMTMTQKAQTYIANNHNWNRITHRHLSLYLKVTAMSKINPIRYRALDN